MVAYRREIQLRYFYLPSASLSSCSFLSSRRRGFLDSSEFSREDTIYDFRDYGSVCRGNAELRSVRISISETEETLQPGLTNPYAKLVVEMIAILVFSGHGVSLAVDKGVA